uniref:Secreted protein n=1 Tax=Oryza meridionalis TaxID=40149 RepID=A0A0E0DZW2_9ORYZ
MGPNFYGALLWHRLMVPVLLKVATTANGGVGIGCESSSYLRLYAHCFSARRCRHNSSRPLTVVAAPALTSRGEGVPPLVVVVLRPTVAALVVVSSHRYGEADREQRVEAIRMGERRAVARTGEARQLKDQDLNSTRPSSEGRGQI